MTVWLSATGTYNYKLAKWLDEKLKPLSVNEHTVNDIFVFADELREMKIKDHEVLVSYDVSSLFTNVPACITGFSLRILVAGERCKVIGKYFERGSSCEWKIVPGNRTLAGEFFIVNGVFSSLWCLMKILVSVLLVFVIWERVPLHGEGDNWKGLS